MIAIAIEVIQILTLIITLTFIANDVTSVDCTDLTRTSGRYVLKGKKKNLTWLRKVHMVWDWEWDKNSGFTLFLNAVPPGWLSG